MDREQILSLEFGDALDLAILEHLHGYRWRRYDWYDGTKMKLLWDDEHWEEPRGDDFRHFDDFPNVIARWDAIDCMDDLPPASFPDWDMDRFGPCRISLNWEGEGFSIEAMSRFKPFTLRGDHLTLIAYKAMLIIALGLEGPVEFR